MGFVAKAKIREKAVGGSAFKKKGILVKKASSSLHGRRETEVMYALKSIILDRVSPMFLEELRNEIDILRGMVRTRERTLDTVFLFGSTHSFSSWNVGLCLCLSL
jgi:hypothetical protein